MACGARSGLKLGIAVIVAAGIQRLNGLWSPFGIETWALCCMHIHTPTGLNGLWSPFGIETHLLVPVTSLTATAKSRVDPFRDQHSPRTGSSYKEFYG